MTRLSSDGLPNSSSLVDFLYLCGLDDVNNKYLIDNNIRTIINVANDCAYNIKTLPSGVEYYHYDIDDNIYQHPNDISIYFDELYILIKKRLARGPVMIHCHQGISRSATFVLLYVMREYNINLMDSYTWLHNQRKIMPQPEFMYQLMREEYDMLGTRSFGDNIDHYTIVYIISWFQLNETYYDRVKYVYDEHNHQLYDTIDDIEKNYLNYW